MGGRAGRARAVTPTPRRVPTLMDPQHQQDLWAIALENYQAAVLMAQHGWHNVSVACSYYAVFTAMWVVLGDPPGQSHQLTCVLSMYYSVFSTVTGVLYPSWFRRIALWPTPLGSSSSWLFSRLSMIH